jgi:alpha-glucosidase
MIEEESVISPDKVDFSGNYIEKHSKQNPNECHSGKVVSWEKVGNSFVFHGENASLELTVISHDILKFRHGNDGFLDDDFSYAITPDKQWESVDYKFEELKASFVIKTETLRCYVSRENLSVKITTADGVTVLQDEKGYHWIQDPSHGGSINICTKIVHKNQKFYGLGDKSCSLALNQKKLELWGTDCYGYGLESDPVYKNIPFFMSQHSKIGYGIFMDNTFRTTFDFGLERPEALSYWSHGGEMRYYYIHGPKLVDVIKKYASLTGTAALPPKWSLGYHQSKWSYYPETVVRNLANEFRTRRIPCDVIHLDIDYMDEFRCFTWDKNKFANPPKMIADLKEQGIKTIVIIDPGIKVDKNYSVYQQGIAGDHFCRRMDGDLLKASVWPGACHFPDFTRKATREWWSTLYEGLAKDGVDGVWNDMNEPATFEEGTFPNDVRHDFDGHPCSHRKAHNVYGSLMAQATNDGQKMFRHDKRPFTITRSAYSGVQRFSSVWTGDNSATWEHLKIANIQCQRLSASGISFVGSDVGGFIGSPDGELFTRWVQMAVFHPFFRTHSSGDHGDKEPWVFGEKYEDLVRDFISMRYRILPYIYSTFWQHSQTGIPMLRSLHLETHDDPETFFREEEFFLGDHLLVCPISIQGATSRLMYFPKGEWYNYWNNISVKGSQELEVQAPLNQIPLFIRAGAVIAEQPTMQYVNEFEFDELTLRLYKPTKETVSEFYEDQGDGYEHLNGQYSLKKYYSKPNNNAWEVFQTVEGEYQTGYQRYKCHFSGLSQAPTSILVDDKPVEYLKFDEGVLEVIVDKNFHSIKLS